MRWPLNGNTGCMFHKSGGTVGIKNGNFKYGKYSKYAPKNINQMIDALHEARREGDYLSIRDQIDLADVRISQLVSLLESSASQKTWLDIRRARLDIIESVKSNDANKLNEALKILQGISTKGQKEYRAWDELFRVQRHYNNLIQSERKKLIEDKFMLSLDDVNIILAMIGHAINEKVKDASTRFELAKEIKLISAKTGFEIT